MTFSTLKIPTYWTFTDNLKTFLDIHIQSLEKVSVIRMNTSVGLMMARQAGIDTTTAEYFVCMDSHMEATEGNCSRKSVLVVS